MPKTNFLRLFAMGLAIAAPPFAFAHTTLIPAVVVVSVPENWGLSDYAGFSALALVVFGVLIRRRLLRTKIDQN
jgi:hypothetical protein